MGWVSFWGGGICGREGANEAVVGVNKLERRAQRFYESRCDPESVGHMQPVPITKSISIKSTSFSTI